MTLKPVQAYTEATHTRVLQPMDNPEVDCPYEPDQKKVTSADFHSVVDREEEEDKREDPESTDDQ